MILLVNGAVVGVSAGSLSTRNVRCGGNLLAMRVAGTSLAPYLPFQDTPPPIRSLVIGR